MVRHYRPGRIFEWFAHLNSIGWGVLLALPGDMLAVSPGFVGLLEAGWSEPLLAVTLTLVGVVGCMALWVNGSKPYGSPRFRAAAAAAGVLVYGQVFAAFIDDFVRHGGPRPGLVTYGLMALFCVYACYQSSRDATCRP